MDIHRAAKRGLLHRVRQLLEADASSFHSRDNDGHTPILVAAMRGQPEVVKFLIHFMLRNRQPSADEDGKDDDDDALGPSSLRSDFTLLYIVSSIGWVDIAQILIEEGLNTVNGAIKCGFTPLFAAATCNQEDVAALLLRSGADVNRRDEGGSTALHWAAWCGHSRLVKLLLQEEGLDLNPQDKCGRTPLHWACPIIDYEGIVKPLLAAGADAKLINRFGESPLSICLKVQNPNLEAINLYVQHGAFFQDCDYGKLSENPVLRENVLKNVDLCTQSVVNKFSYQTLPALYSSPYFASMLPPMGNFMLNTSQKEEVKNSVRRDIQQNTFCNVVRVRPTALSALCAQCLAAYTASRR